MHCKRSLAPVLPAQVNAQDYQEHQSAVVKGGVASGMIALGTGAVGAVGLQRMNVAAWRGLTLPLKAFALTSITTAGFIIGADSASRKFELSKYSVGSGTQLEKISHEQQRLENEAGIGKKAGPQTTLGTKDAVLDWAKTNRWSVVFGSWVASMAGSGAYIAASPLSFAQKLVQARMVAQGLTVAVVLASAALTQIPNAEGISDDEAKRIDREQGMYAWKKGSPHDQKEKEQKA
ncbi:Rcf2p [Sporobolomyces koalae]|uniref:Rcf2p n=1 Tax=Sporobolomyces koalae TaxID=500713 RepID=UPI00316E0702